MLGLEKPDIIKGVPQKPLEGVSFKSGFADKDAKTGKDVQYFEMYGNRSIYKDGWKAVTNHEFTEDYSKDVWELYHVEEDYSEKHNVADQYPEKVKELEQEWFIQASKYGVFPMEKFGFHAYRDQMGKKYKGISLPAVHKEYKNVAFPYDLPSDPGLSSRTNTITIALNRKSAAEEGVLISSGDRFGGFSIYVLHNKLHYVYNLYGETFYHAVSDGELPLGESELQIQFTVEGKGKATVELFINGVKNGETKIEEFNYMTMGVTSFRIDKFTSVNEADYLSPFEYTGEIPKIVLDVAAIKVDPKEELEKQLHAD
jgi:arylsulfatase